MLATDLADHLARRGVPFREAHALAGRAVRHALKRDVPLNALEQTEWEAIHPRLRDVASQVFDPEVSVARRAALGGTAPAAVAEQLVEARNRLKSRQFA
jgi:argininosuccinate lyase